MMRVFAALPMPEHVLDAVERWMEPLRESNPGLKWVRRDHQHITVRFLGEVDEKRVEQLRLAASRCNPGGIPFVLDRVDVFRRGSGGPATVLWLGGIFGSGVMELAKALGRVPDHHGRTSDSRGFVPHLTVARRRRRGPAIPRGLPPLSPVEGVAEELVLYSSRLTSSGPRYNRLHVCRL